MTPYIFFLIAFLFADPLWAADLTVTWATAPGSPGSIDIAVWGGGIKGPDDPRALRLTGAVNTTSRTVKGVDIEAAFPGTDYICTTARKKGDTAWWSYADGTYACGRWPSTAIPAPPVSEPPVVIPPAIPPVAQPAVTRGDLDAVLALIDETEKRVTAKADALLLQQRQSIVGALDKCLARPVQGHQACMKTLRDALKEVKE